MMFSRNFIKRKNEKIVWLIGINKNEHLHRHRKLIDVLKFSKHQLIVGF